MIIINTIDSNRFAVNGVTYFKNFMSDITGDKLRIFNVYDTKYQLLHYTTYSQFTVDGNNFSSAEELQAILSHVIYTRNSGIGTGAGGSSGNDPDGLIIGNIEHIEDYQYRFIAQQYRINGTTYTTVLNKVIEFDAADPDDNRVDLVIIKLVSGVPQIDVIKGVAATPTSKPILEDIETQIEFTFITVEANTTGPGDIQNTLVYDEYAQEVGGEFDCYASSVFILPEDNTQPFVGTKHVRFNLTPENEFITFKTTTPVNTLNKNLLIKFKQRVIHNYKFQISINDANNYGALMIEGNAYGLDSNSIDYQSLIIPFSDFGASSFDEIIIRNKREGADFYLDFINLQSSTLPDVSSDDKKTIFEFISDVIPVNLSAGEIVRTLNYSSPNDNGGGVYEIRNSYEHTDEYGLGFTLSNGKVAVLINDTITASHFGVFSDSTTVWNIDEASRWEALLRAAVVTTIVFESPVGSYFNSQLLLNETHSNARFHFKNAAFSHLIHIVGDAADVKNITLTGHLITYDRFGVVNIDGMFGKLNVTMKSNPIIHLLDTGGRGAHIYAGAKNINLGTLVVEGNDQTAAGDVKYGVGIDGSSENVNVDYIWIKDCETHGVHLEGLGHHINSIRVDRYGSDTFNSSSSGLGSTSYNDEASSQVACGVIMLNTDAYIGQIVVDQKDGFAGRSRALTDVLVAKYTQETVSSTTVYTKRFPTIGSITSLNPQRQVFAGCPYKNTGAAKIGVIKIGAISDDNLMQADTSGVSVNPRARYALIDCYKGHFHIDNVFFIDARDVRVVQQRRYDTDGTTDFYTSVLVRELVSLYIGSLSQSSINTGGSRLYYDDGTLAKGDGKFLWQAKINFINCYLDANNHDTYTTP